MKGTRHSEQQIIAILKQGEAGLTTAELCRQHVITEQTYYRWKAKCGGMDSGEAQTGGVLQHGQRLGLVFEPLATKFLIERTRGYKTLGAEKILAVDRDWHYKTSRSS